MFEKLLQESGNKFVGSRISGISGRTVDDEEIINIPVSTEGRAVIVNVYVPSGFTSGVPFFVGVVIRNDGWSDDLFIKVTNIDTGEVILRFVMFVPGGAIDGRGDEVTLVQETDFNGLVEVGHIEGVVVTP